MHENLESADRHAQMSRYHATCIVLGDRWLGISDDFPTGSWAYKGTVLVSRSRQSAGGLACIFSTLGCSGQQCNVFAFASFASMAVDPIEPDVRWTMDRICDRAAGITRECSIIRGGCRYYGCKGGGGVVDVVTLILTSLRCQAPVFISGLSYGGGRPA
ncbi:hypothetical protein BGZ60DRAFT_104823 [Tricladium varicosporioides]|nr:hypothetical protein BGZ60DRAFT_104823 [Hymenoscyphus varicosporioides]